MNRWEIGASEPSEFNIRQLANILNISVSLISDLTELQKLQPFFYEKLDALEKNSLDITAKTDSEKLDLFLKLQERLELLLWENNYYKTVFNQHAGIIQSMKLLVYEKDISHRYTFVNNYFLSYFNISSYKLILGQRNSDIWKSKNGWDELLELEHMVFKTGESQKHEKIEIPKLLGANGKGIISISPVKDSENKVIKIVGYIMDLTSEEVLREKFFYMENMLDNLEHVIWITKSKPFRHYLYISKAVQSIYNVIPAEFYKDANKWQDFIIKEDKKRISEELSCGRKELQYRIKIYDGTIKWIEHFIYNTIINNENFEFGVIKDITELKNIKEIQEMLQINIEAMTDGLFVAEVDSGKYIYMNKAIYITYGYTIDDFNNGGREFWRKKCLHPDFLNEHARKVPCKDGAQKYQFKIIRSDGGIRWIDSTVNTRTVYGKKCFISIERDITELKSKEAIQNLLGAAMDFMPYGVLIFNDEGKIIFTNTKVLDMLEFSSDKITGKDVSLLDKYFNNDVVELCNSRKNTDAILTSESGKHQKVKLIIKRSDMKWFKYYSLIIQTIQE